jgi:hypothetical protein
MNLDIIKVNFFAGYCHGKGTDTNPDQLYVGEFFKDSFHGVGTRKDKNGSVYTGNFFDNKPHGHGKIIFENGSIHEGNFFAGKFHGFGKEIDHNSTYEGEFFAGERHGPGKLTYDNGTIIEVVYNAGIVIKMKGPGIDGKTIEMNRFGDVITKSIYCEGKLESRIEFI